MSEQDPPIQIPASSLGPETLHRVAEEYVTRDGTDYGAVEVSLEQKVSNLLREIESGRAEIWFDPETETISVAPTATVGRSRET